MEAREGESWLLAAMVSDELVLQSFTPAQLQNHSVL